MCKFFYPQASFFQPRKQDCFALRSWQDTPSLARGTKIRCETQLAGFWGSPRPQRKRRWSSDTQTSHAVNRSRRATDAVASTATTITARSARGARIRASWGGDCSTCRAGREVSGVTRLPPSIRVKTCHPRRCSRAASQPEPPHEPRATLPTYSISISHSHRSRAATAVLGAEIAAAVATGRSSPRTSRASASSGSSSRWSRCAPDRRTAAYTLRASSSAIRCVASAIER